MKSFLLISTPLGGDKPAAVSKGRLTKAWGRREGKTKKLYGRRRTAGEPTELGKVIAELTAHIQIYNH